MGSNTSAVHASYSVAPTATIPITDPMAGPGMSATQHLQEAVLAIHKAQIIAAGGGDPEDPYGLPVVDVDPDDPVGTYDVFCTAIAEAKQHLAAMEDTELADGELAALHDELALKSQNYLGGLSVEDLQQIAAAKGFEHPELAGTDLYGQHPLAHWLDPSCDTDLVSQAKVQAKALQRFNTQAANSPEAFASAPVEGTWQATAEEMLAAGAEAIDLAKHYKQLVVAGEESPQALAGLIAAENKVATGVCPEGAGIDVAKLRATVRGQVDQALAGSQLPGWQEQAKSEQKAGNLTMDEAYLLSPTQTIALLRANTPPAERTAVKATADLRGAQMEAMWAAHDTLIKLTNSVDHGLAIAVQGEELQDLLDTTSTYASARAAVLEWKDQAPGWAPLTMTSAKALVDQPLEAWVKQQKLPALRKAAAEVGMEGANTASRAAIKTWIAASWTQIEAPITPATSGHQTGSTPGPPKQPASNATKPTSSPPPPGGGAAGGFVAKHRDLVSALQQAKATAADLPARHNPGEVAAWTFGPGKTAALGGMHTKTVHTAPDGSAWMFKPDKTNHGARAHAEAAASAAFHTAGVPSVPVYVKKVGSKTGSIQPLISNAHPLPASPADWSQADVDAIVRFHVACWMVGDHDGKSDNVLRTPSGGLVPIDQGQAFKFYGEDKLAIDYHPNASFGAERPVFQQAYEAHVAGKLGKGVAINPAVAHPVIKAFEAIPDAQWRALLHDTAHEGANHDVAWVPTMRKQAAKELGLSAKEVTPAQIADAFLDHAVERKHGLRSAFTKLFSGTLKLPGGAALRDTK